MNNLNGYVCIYNGRQIEVYAPSLYEAKQEAVRQFRPPKSKQHRVSAHLAEKNGEPVVHVADF